MIKEKELRDFIKGHLVLQNLEIDWLIYVGVNSGEIIPEPVPDPRIGKTGRFWGGKYSKEMGVLGVLSDVKVDPISGLKIFKRQGDGSWSLHFEPGVFESDDLPNNLKKIESLIMDCERSKISYPEFFFNVKNIIEG